ncbi:MAG: hypothetical protein AAGA15_02790 [Pseudomonadota bacterium]
MDVIPADPDLWFVIGVVLVIFCIPSLFSAWTDGRTPRAGAVTVLIAICMLGYASYTNPQGYEFREIPTVFSEVIGRYLL